MIDVALYTSSGYRYATPAPAQDVTFSHTRKGAGALSAYFPMSLDEAFRLYSHSGLLYAVATEEGGIVWRGRVEDVKISNRGAEIQGFGLANFFDDTLYTALWSRTSTADWLQVTDSDLASRTPERYETDNNNRLYIALRTGESYANTVDIGEWTYAIPHNSDRDIVAFSASYDLTLPTNWQLRLIRCDADFTKSNVIQTITGTGGNTAGAISQTFTGQARLLVQVRNNTGSTYAATGDTGDWYVKLTDVRVKTTTAATVLASDIALALYNDIPGTTSGHISGYAITATTVDLQDEIYEDMRPSAILDDLAFRSGMTWGVDSHGVFFWRSRDTVGNRYFVDALSIELERSLAGIYNQTYGIYNDANGYAQRTATADDALSKAVYGVTREEMIQANTTSATQAEAHRDALLADSAFYVVRASIEFDTIYDATGQRVSGASIQGNDTVTIRNLPPQLATDLDELATFTIDTADFDAETGKLQLQPALPIPTLVTLIAQG